MRFHLSGEKIAHMDRLICLNSPTIADVNPDLQILHCISSLATAVLWFFDWILHFILHARIWIQVILSIILRLSLPLNSAFHAAHPDILCNTYGVFPPSNNYFLSPALHIKQIWCPSFVDRCITFPANRGKETRLLVNLGMYLTYVRAAHFIWGMTACQMVYFDIFVGAFPEGDRLGRDIVID